MHEDGVNGDLSPWDWRYYAEKRRAVEHDLDEAALKPYFQLDRMIEASFSCATRLFGLEFKPLDVPLYHEDCRAWDVTRDGAHVAVFIGDYFARGSKRSGAWCSAMRAQAKFPKVQSPVVMNVCNFAKVIQRFCLMMMRVHCSMNLAMLCTKCYPTSLTRASLVHQLRAILSNCPASYMNTGSKYPKCWASLPPTPKRVRRCPKKCWIRCWVPRPLIWAFQRLNMSPRRWLI